MLLLLKKKKKKKRGEYTGSHNKRTQELSFKNRRFLSISSKIKGKVCLGCGTPFPLGMQIQKELKAAYLNTF